MLELIERKAHGEEIAVQPEAEEPREVPDLMAALEASLAAVKDPEAGERSRTASRTAGESHVEERRQEASSRAKAGSKK